MKLKNLPAVFVFILCCLLHSNAATFYIDFASGSDANNGTTKSAPWKHVNGMNNQASGKAASHVYATGDTLIFKGGVTWDSTCFPDTCPEANGLTFTTDSSWYIGSTFTRPIWDCQEKIMRSHKAVMCWYRNNITYNNIELCHYSGIPDSGAPCGFSFASCRNIVITNNFIHDWTTPGTHRSAGAGALYINYTHPVICSYNNIKGRDSTDGEGILQVGTGDSNFTITHNRIDWVVGGIMLNGECYNTEVAYNEISNVWQGHYDSLLHTDVFMINGHGYGSNHNNIVHDCGTLVHAYNGGNWKIYNNVEYRLKAMNATVGSQTVTWSANGNTCDACTLAVYNNYFEGLGVTYVLNHLPATHQGGIKIINNIFNSDITYPGCIRFSDTLNSIVIDHNLYVRDSSSNPAYMSYFGTNLNRSQARALGWDTSGIWTTTTGLDSLGVPSVGSAVIGKGKNLYSYFTNDMAGNARPSVGPWDIGAYEYVAGTAAAQHVPNRQALSPATIRLRGTGFTVALPSSLHSPELTIIGLSGRIVYRMVLSAASRKADPGDDAVYDCAWCRVPVVGVYIADIKETSRDGAQVLARTKFVVGK